MGPLIVLLGFMAITVIMGIILTETNKNTKIITLIVIAVGIMILLMTYLALGSVFVLLESCDSCVTEVGALG